MNEHLDGVCCEHKMNSQLEWNFMVNIVQDRKTYCFIIEEMFNDGIVNIGRCIVLFHFTKCIAKKKPVLHNIVWLVFIKKVSAIIFIHCVKKICSFCQNIFLY